MEKRITEGKAEAIIHEGKISKDLPVFYNPAMKLNRDLTIEFLKALDRPMKACLPLAGSGIRGIRMLLELDNIDLHMNDGSPEAYQLIKKNLKLNDVKATVENKEAAQFMIENTGFDYIDIDPFGSPNPFLDTAIRRLSREGILAVTATDTSALCGTYRKATRRKYWAESLKNSFMHETGLRILIRKVQLIAAQYERALIPMLSYSTDHYMRVFFICHKGKQKVDQLDFKYLLYCSACLHRKLSSDNSGACNCKEKFSFAGPLYAGPLWDNIVKKMDLGKLEVIKDEMDIDTPFYYNIQDICKTYGIKHQDKLESIIQKLRDKGHKCSRTHFREQSIRTDAGIKEIAKAIRPHAGHQ